MRAVYGCLAILFVGLLSGCGGGGGGTPFLLSSSLRMLQVGDQWTYNVTGTQTTPGGPTLNITGTYTQSIVQQNINGQNYLAQSSALNLTATGGGGVTNNSITYFSQDPATHNGVIYADKDNTNPIRIVTNNPLPTILPGTWSNSTAYAYTLNYNDSSTNTDTLSVSNTETVSSPVGSFAAWKVTRTSDDSLYGSANGTEWWAPQMGAPIKSTATRTFSGGTTLTLTAILASTNVPLQ